MTGGLIVTTVGHLVVERPERWRVLERLGIDYCCGGRRTLGQACREAGLDSHAVARELLEEPTDDAPEARRAPMCRLTGHICDTHHRYLRDTLPRLRWLADSAVACDGGRRPRLAQARQVIHALAEHLHRHMAREEADVFPACRGEGALRAPTHTQSGAVYDPIRDLMEDHGRAGEMLEKIRALTDDYTPPPDASDSHRRLLEGLARLEQDMHRHVHEENNILFPLVLADAASREPLRG